LISELQRGCLMAAALCLQSSTTFGLASCLIDLTVNAMLRIAKKRIATPLWGSQ